MKRVVFSMVATLLAITPPLTAARVTAVAVTHPAQQVFQAYRGLSSDCTKAYKGYMGTGGRTVTTVPGVLSISPGENWSNYVGAARDGVPYAIKNVVLQKQTPAMIQCADVLTARTISQQGTRNVRLWWPLLYETAGTVWTLTILYGTTVPYDNDGPGGPNPLSYVHTEVWQWELGVSLDSMGSLLALMHTLPFGTSQVPLISDENFYRELETAFDEVLWAMMAGDSVGAGLALGQFEMLLMDRCVAAAPDMPNPGGPGTGVALSHENPACCVLLTNAEYLGFDLGIYQPAR